MPDYPPGETPIFDDGVQLYLSGGGDALTVTPLYGDPVTVAANRANVAMATVGPDGEPTGDSYGIKMNVDPTLGQDAHQYTITRTC
jgi:hypothetical protein